MLHAHVCAFFHVPTVLYRRCVWNLWFCRQHDQVYSPSSLWRKFTCRLLTKQTRRKLLQKVSWNCLRLKRAFATLVNQLQRQTTKGTRSSMETQEQPHLQILIRETNHLTRFDCSLGHSQQLSLSPFKTLCTFGHIVALQTPLKASM